MREDDDRAPFFAAASAFCELVDQVRADDWERPALGEWDVRGLVGHASRALATTETYLAARAEGPVRTDPVEYFRAVLAPAADADARARQDAAIAERGRAAGAELGDDPRGAVRGLADRVVALVARTPGDALLATPVGAMTLSGYLPTRTFELTVHSLDLARALSLDPPPSLGAGIAASCVLAGRLAARSPHAASLLLVLTGRTGGTEGARVL